MANTLRPRVRQTEYKLRHTRGPDVIRMYHDNITRNHRVRKVARVKVPPIVTRAQLIVEQRRFIPIATKKVDQ